MFQNAAKAVTERLKKRNRIDHLAIAVLDIEAALALYRDVFGFEVKERREVNGVFSGMKSVELDAHGFSIVLVQGVGEESQVSRYIAAYGPGVQHVAIEVDDVEVVEKQLKDRDVAFATDVIQGKKLVQVFTQRNSNCGMMFEFVHRREAEEGFETGNVESLFAQLEAKGAF